MATTVRAVSLVASGVGTAVAITRPTGTTAGDLVLVFVTNNNLNSVVDNNGATPFTLDAFISQTVGNGSISMFSRRIQAGDPATYNFTIGASQRYAGVAVTLQNPHPSAIYDVSYAENHTTGATTNTINAPSITTATPGAIHFAVYAIDGSSNTTTATPAGYTVQANGGQQLIVVTTKVIASPAATGAKTTTWTNVDAAIAMSFAIRDVTTAAAALMLTIAGVDRTVYLKKGSVDVQYQLGGRGSLRCLVVDRSVDSTGAYRPTVDQSILLTNGGSTVFSGLILGVEDYAAMDPDAGVITAITAMDEQRVLSQRLLNVSYAAGQTLKDVVTGIQSTYLSVYNITLDPTMAAGPTLEAQVFDLVSAEAGLSHLSDLSGYAYRVLPTKVLEMFAIGTKVAAYSLTSANAKVVGGVRWNKTRRNYVNTVYVRYGTNAQVEKTHSMVGTGAVNDYPLDYTPALDANGFIVSSGYVTDAGAFSNIGLFGVDPNVWTWNPSNNVLHRTTNLPAAQVATFVYSAQFPQYVSATDATEVINRGPFDVLIDARDVFDKDAAQEIADGLLRRYLVVPRELTVTTRGGLEFPGTTFTVTMAERTLSGTWLITGTGIRDLVNGTLIYTYQCLEGTEAQGNWTDFWRGVIGGGGGPTTVGGGTVTGGVIPQMSALMVSGTSRLGGQIVQSGILSPPQITANQNNYNPTGLASASALLISSDAARDITGIETQPEGTQLDVINAGSFPITLKNASGSSAAGNQFSIGADLALAADHGVSLRMASSKWRATGV